MLGNNVERRTERVLEAECTRSMSCLTVCSEAVFDVSRLDPPHAR